jgi:hypothetical protein
LERFAGLVDTVSGDVRAPRRWIRRRRRGGLAGGPSFPRSILPFILRSIAVYGMVSDAAGGRARRRGGGSAPTCRSTSSTAR